MSVNTDIWEASTSLFHDFLLFTDDEVTRFIKLVDSYDKELVNRLRENGLEELTKSELSASKKAVAEVYAEAKEVFDNELNGVVTKVASEASMGAIAMIQQNMPIAINLVAPTSKQILAAVRMTPINIGGNLSATLTQMLDKHWKDKEQAVTNRLASGYLFGETNDQIIRSLTGTKKLGYKDGLLNSISRSSAEKVVRTSMISSANIARQMVYDENEKFIKGVQWDATLDTRTCPVCGALDGKMDTKDKKELEGKRPPAHLNCRCTIIPVIKSLKELGLDVEDYNQETRVSMDGDVPARTTYSEWFDKQSVERKKAILGEGKFALYQKGELKINSFADTKNLRIKTLDEVKKG